MQGCQGQYVDVMNVDLLQLIGAQLKRKNNCGPVWMNDVILYKYF